MDRTKTYICTQTLPCLKTPPTWRHVDKYLRPLLRNKIYIFAQNRDNHVCTYTHSQPRNMLMDICTHCHIHHTLFPERLWHLLPSFENLSKSEGRYIPAIPQIWIVFLHNEESSFTKNLPPRRIFPRLICTSYCPMLTQSPTKGSMRQK